MRSEYSQRITSIKSLTVDDLEIPLPLAEDPASPLNKRLICSEMAHRLRQVSLKAFEHLKGYWQRLPMRNDVATHLPTDAVAACCVHYTVCEILHRRLCLIYV